MTDRICPICNHGWEQDEDDVRECRACGGSGILGPMIPKAPMYGPELDRTHGRMSVGCHNVTFTATTTADELAERLRAILRGFVNVEVVGEKRVAFNGTYVDWNDLEKPADADADEGTVG